jgi:hypothetical protein
MKHEKIDVDAPTHDVYEGMHWTGASKKGYKAVSSTTRSTYLVEPGAGSLWCVRHGFPDAPGRPNTLIGQFADKEVALVAAERHDFRYWKSSSDRAGVDALFVGSKGTVADFVAALPEHERDEATEMLISEFTLVDGRPFSAAASFFGAIKSGLKQERNGKYTLTLTVDPEMVPLWLMQNGIGAELTIGAVETGKTLDDEWRERGKAAIRRAAVLPADNSFQGWILQRYDRWGLVKSSMAKTTDDVEAAVEETLRRIIGCPSRRELATNRDAIMRLERLDREFYLDLSRGIGSEP